MTFINMHYHNIIVEAKRDVPGFAPAHNKFIEKATISRSSMSLIINYSRCLSYVALEFNRCPHEVSIDELNSYLYRIMVKHQRSFSTFKHFVFALKYWFRLYNMEEKAIKMPPIKKEKKLPVVLAKWECRELFKAPRSLKHRFLLALAYGSGLRMNELRLIRLTDVDVHRLEVHVRHGKGRKDRYVPLPVFLLKRLPGYLKTYKPQTWLFEGNIPGEPIAPRSIQFIINEALAKTTIAKNVSMHTLRHSFATHLLEEGIDIHSIQQLLGHAELASTIQYLHVARIRTKPVHSPLDTLYETL
jgi:site-specific recombinase XerD